MQFGLMLRAQFPEGDDMSARFQELLEQARLADALGFDSVTKGMHYSSPPWQSLQQLPFLSRVMAEAPRLRLNLGLILLSLHKPLDVAEQIATVDVMSGGKVIFGVALGYRDVEFLAFGTTQKARVRRAARLGDCWYVNPHNRIETIVRQVDLPARARRVRQAVPGRIPGPPRAVRRAVAPGGDPALRAVPVGAKYKAYQEWGQGAAMPEGDNDLGVEFDEPVRDRFIIGSPDEVAEQMLALHRATGIHHLIMSAQWPGMPQSLALDELHMLPRKYSRECGRRGR